MGTFADMNSSKKMPANTRKIEMALIRMNFLRRLPIMA